MHRILRRYRLKRKATRHARSFPEDTLVVQSVLDAIDCEAKSAREAAELALGRGLSSPEWAIMRHRWERPWKAITD